MATPKAHEQHAEHAAKAANRKPDPAEHGDGGAADASQATPTGLPTSDRHQTETAAKARK